MAQFQSETETSKRPTKKKERKKKDLWQTT